MARKSPTSVSAADMAKMAERCTTDPFAAIHSSIRPSADEKGFPFAQALPSLRTMSLSPSEIERYARHIVLRNVGGPGQQKLKSARVLMVGAGGLGSPALQYLAAAGIGTLGVVDDDLVSLSNLQRQVLHSTEEVGRPKVESAARSIARLNPHVEVRAHQKRLDAGSFATMTLLRTVRIILKPAISFLTLAILSASRSSRPLLELLMHRSQACGHSSKTRWESRAPLTVAFSRNRRRQGQCPHAPKLASLAP
jgi:hypothetical protein